MTRHRPTERAATGALDSAPPAALQEVSIVPRPLEQLAAVLTPARAARLTATATRARAAFGGCVVWHVSSTASGGGVAEMLQTLLAYGNGAGIENRWLVIDADPGFFTITKRIHNMLHGHPGDNGSLGPAEHRHYAAQLERNLPALLAKISPTDIVVLHDPQTAGLVRRLRDVGVRVLWRCHIGSDQPNHHTETAWRFLYPYAAQADAFVFSRREYAPAWAQDRLDIIPPSIDPFSPKNTPLSRGEVAAVLARVGLVDGLGPGRPVSFHRRDGSTGHVRPHHASIVLDGHAPPTGVPLVVQVSRWDRLKDMAGVMTGFAEMLRHDLPSRPHLMLLGPDVTGVADDPEGAGVLAACRHQREQLPDSIRDRIHLAAVPMDDLDENGLIVNAVQRYADVVVQKSLVEGFGLTVTEAMWKERPVLASRVGGIQDQIRHERDGLLLDDPADPVAFAGLLRRVLEDHGLAARLGVAARARVLDQYVGDRHLEQYADVLSRLSA